MLEDVRIVISSISAVTLGTSVLLWWWHRPGKWTITARSRDSRRVAVESRTGFRTPVPQLIREVLGAFEARVETPPGVRAAMEHYDSIGPRPDRDPVELWNTELAGRGWSDWLAPLRFGVLRLEAGRPVAAVWHDESFFIALVPPGAVSLRIRYRPARAARSRVLEFTRPLSLRGRVRLVLGGRPRKYLQYTAYFGEASVMASGIARIRGLHRTAIHLGGHPGLVVGNVVRRLGTEAVTSDGSMHKRIEHWMEAAGHRPRVPELSAKVGRSPGPLVVFVHGTMSTGLRHDVALDALRVSPVWALCRWEHDTFEPIAHNADDLAERVREVVPPHRPILFVGHSRGGLVAKDAAHRLQGDGRRCQVITLGAPHEGTPVAKGGQLVYDGLVAAATVSVRAGGAAVGLPDPATAIAGLFLRTSLKFPQGISDMVPLEKRAGRVRKRNETGSYLSLMRTLDVEVYSLGGTWEVPRKMTGRIPAIWSKHGPDFFAGVFGGQNDSVVSLQSALAGGEPVQVSGAPCAHGDYLFSDFVRGFIRERRQKMT